jgi:thioredoxin reductase
MDKEKIRNLLELSDTQYVFLNHPEADTTVTALPLLPNAGLAKSLEGSAPEVYAIGDCREPHLIVDAIADGSRLARAI